MTAELLFLGTGGSMGIPVIGCRCPVCSSKVPQNRRLRPAALIRVLGKQLLIDPGSDFRQQALQHQIDWLDGVLFTHDHHDHTGGLDDLRAYFISRKEPLSCLLSQETFAHLQKRYGYLFQQKSPTLAPRLDWQQLPKKRGEFSFQGVRIGYFSYEQAGMGVTGFRFGNFAYITDIKHYPKTIFEDLVGVEVLVLSALRHETSPLHLSVAEAISFGKEVGAKELFLTHIAHEVDYETTSASLPADVWLAYDGLKIYFQP